MIVLGLVGHMGSGRTTVAEFLAETFDFELYSFADNVRAVCTLVGFEESRKNLRGIGAALRAWKSDVWVRGLRAWKSDVWVRGLDADIEAWREMFPEERMVITDVRYANEAEYVRVRGGKLIGLWASYEDLYERVKARDNLESMGEYITHMGHESEAHIDELLKDCHIRVDTTHGLNGTLATVKAFVERCIGETKD